MAEIENLQIVGGAIYTVGNQDIIADDWEAGKAYIKDRSYAIKDHKLYQCAVSHTSVEPFDPTKWTEKTVAEALGTAGSANMIECTLAEYTAWKAGGQLINETVYVITDAPNLNATAQDISYDGGADTVWDKVESLGASDIAFDSSTLPYTAGNVQSAIGTLSTFAREDVSTQIANGYANLTDVTAELFRIGNVGILQIRCHCTGTISSGTVTLTTSIKSDANYSFRGALGCIDSKSGFMEYNNKTFLIRCPASTTNYLVGAIVFAIGF